MFNITDDNRKWWILLAMSCSMALVFIDQTALAVALPPMQHDLHTTNSVTQWFINAYLLALSALVLFGGKIGDMLGHRKTFLFGVTLFISASILCALSETGWWAVMSRAIQGIGGAFMIPSSGALVANAFSEEERGKAMGIYIAIAAIFLSVGPLLGGVLTQWISWRAVFWINLPIALISIILTVNSAPKLERTQEMIIDWLGLILSATFMTSIVLLFMEAPHFGWTSLFIRSLSILSIISFIGFIFWEKKAKNPLVDLTMFKNPLFSLAIIIMLTMQAVFVVFVFWAIFLQNGLQFKPAMAGFLLLPITVPIVFMSPLGGHLRDKYGYRPSMIIGSILVVISLLWVAMTSPYHSYAWLFPGLLAFGMTMPLVISGYMTAVMSSAKPQQRGTAGGIANCIRQLGSAIGLAVFGSLIETLSKNGSSYIHAFSITMYAVAALALMGVLLILKMPRK